MISASTSIACGKSASRQFPIRNEPLNVGIMIETDMDSMVPANFHHDSRQQVLLPKGRL
jgi:hypothetical protein